MNQIRHATMVVCFVKVLQERSSLHLLLPLGLLIPAQIVFGQQSDFYSNAFSAVQL